MASRRDNIRARKAPYTYRQTLRTSLAINMTVLLRPASALMTRWSSLRETPVVPNWPPPFLSFPVDARLFPSWRWRLQFADGPRLIL